MTIGKGKHFLPFPLKNSAKNEKKYGALKVAKKMEITLCSPFSFRGSKALTLLASSFEMGY
jgi:hypothetical protein